MSLELSADKLEIRDDATNGLVLNHATKLLPVVQKVSLTNVDLAFPDFSKGTAAVINTGTTTSSPTRGQRYYAFGLMINAGRQAGAINLAPITPGLNPNFILGRFQCYRSVNPREDIFGPFIKSILENQLISGRAGRLEFSAWARRIFWIDIAGGYVRLNWVQSARNYSPNSLDPNWASQHPQRYLNLRRPPAYGLGSRTDTNPGGPFDPPIASPPAAISPSLYPAVPASISFASTWRFSKIDLWLGQY